MAFNKNRKIYHNPVTQNLSLSFILEEILTVCKSMGSKKSNTATVLLRVGYYLLHGKVCGIAD